MPVFSAQQRATLVSWRNSLALVNQRASEAYAVASSLLALDENPSLNGNVTADEVFADGGGRWNDARDKLNDAAEALPQYEA